MTDNEKLHFYDKTTIKQAANVLVMYPLIDATVSGNTFPVRVKMYVSVRLSTRLL